MMYDFIKRILDILGSMVGLIIFSPILIAAAVWIKIVSPEGPVFADIPLRVGRYKKGFKLYKFRSMVPNADAKLKADTELYAKYVSNSYKLPAEEDPRIIKGGIFLRKFSIDEVPQFLNILRGEMSLVGPRAYYFFEIEEQLKRFPEVKESLDLVHTVKPGLTGVWQISGRSAVAFPDRVRMDASYASIRSIMYDLLIILKTPYVVLSRKGSV